MIYNKSMFLQKTEIMVKAGILLWLWITGDAKAQVQCQSATLIKQDKTTMLLLNSVNMYLEVKMDH